MQYKQDTKLHFVMKHQETPNHYAVYRCRGPLGCGERVTKDALGEHAGRQHQVYNPNQIITDTSLLKDNKAGD